MSTKLSIAECNVERIVIEESMPFNSGAHFKTGAYLHCIDSLHRFAPAGRSALVEHFRLEDVIFDGQTGALFKNGRHISESRYGTSLEHTFVVDPLRVTRCSGDE